MSVVLIGGHDRMNCHYKELAKSMGHKIKIYTQMPARFSKAIGSPDAILFFTSTVSHKMVRSGMSEAKKLKIPVLKTHRSSGVSLKDALEELEATVKSKKG